MQYRGEDFGIGHGDAGGIENNRAEKRLCPAPGIAAVEQDAAACGDQILQGGAAGACGGIADERAHERLVLTCADRQFCREIDQRGHERIARIAFRHDQPARA